VKPQRQEPETLPPLYVFCGPHLPAAKLRPANIDASGFAPKDGQILLSARVATAVED
jgi:hypothetical protein